MTHKDDIERKQLFEAYDVLDPPHMKVLKITEEPEGYQEWKNLKNKDADFELKGHDDDSTPTLMGTIDDVEQYA